MFLPTRARFWPTPIACPYGSCCRSAFPLAAGIALLAEPIVAVVAGREYLPESAIALSILICYLPLSYANGLTQYVLIAAGRQRLLTGAFVAALVFNVAANLILIPRFGYVGAALVTVASEIVLLVPFARAAAKVAPGVSLLREARIPLLATLLMAPVVWWLRDAIHPLAAIAAGAVIYPRPCGAWAASTPSRSDCCVNSFRDSPFRPDQPLLSLLPRKGKPEWGYSHSLQGGRQAAPFPTGKRR